MQKEGEEMYPVSERHPRIGKLAAFLFQKRPVRQYLALFSMTLILAFVLGFAYYPRPSKPPPDTSIPAVRTILPALQYEQFHDRIYVYADEISPIYVGNQLENPGSIPDRYAIKGVDPSESIAIMDCWLLRYNYTIDSTFQWNGVTYRIKFPVDVSTGAPYRCIGETGKFIL